MQLGVHSEIGKLRKVMVSRPSLAHERLTPGNCHDLLFDDVIWVQKARSDHADFVLKMKDRGIEVFDIQDLLTDILRDSPEARAFILDRRITPNQVGPALAKVIRPWLDEADPHFLARHLLGGVVLEDMPAEIITPLMRDALSETEFLVKPVPNALFQRDPSCWIYGGVTCNPMYWAARKPEALFQRAVYKFHPEFTGNAFEIWWGDSDEDWGNTSMEGGDVMPIGRGVVLIGMGERTTRQAVNQVADRLFEKGAAERVIACAMPKSRAAMHLDTVFTCLEGSLEKRNHWEKTSHALLVGAILHVLYAEPDKTLAGVAAFLSDPKRPIESTLAAMMRTAHLGEAGPHPVIASAARELLNKSDNERSGVLSTAMSFLGLYRDPVVAEVTRRCDWRIADLVGAERPATLYLVVPPSDIARTKPLIRLILNQIGRRLTEELHATGGRHRLLLMLDEFPALGRLDFFESALAFMAGYGLKSFLIAQSLNQIEKAYGANNSILDNCHVRVSFATNDERTAKRVSDALGTATEMKAMKNYAGHRLSPWLGHLMVSRSETARQLLTPGEVMQLPPADEIVMVAGTPPIRAKKARYYEDPRLAERVLPPPATTPPAQPRPDDWTGLPLPAAPAGSIGPSGVVSGSGEEDTTESERRHQPELTRVPPAEPVAPIGNEFEFGLPDDADEDDAARKRRLARLVQGVARQVALDPRDGMEL